LVSETPTLGKPKASERRKEMAEKKKPTTRNGAAVVDNQNTMTAGPRGPVRVQEVHLSL
jgi:catalase